ncbi:AMP-binding protein [Ornithinicoccus halotolerans]|uniref:AMP-binding protein n=1 Tax=Ornithinicoccus halotolerans TaxID=1748220 RepID=UPI0012955CE6|nr:AMP-binding protein [Ornithinicoccus halotolerans]
MTLASCLQAAAAESPQRVFVRTEREAMTYAECWQRAVGYARRLRQRGIGRGDTVALMMTNSAEQVALWMGISVTGAVHAPLNTSLVGDHLAHALTVARPRVVVVDDRFLLTAAEALERAGFATSLVPGAEMAAEIDAQPGSATMPTASVLTSVAEMATGTLLFTSGTTGPSKACELSHRYLRRQGELHAKYLRITADDVLYCPFPLFHIDAATLTVSAALSRRATAALSTRFSASRFWDEVRAFDATVFNFMGATLSILWKQPPTERDRDHRVRLAWGVPLPEWAPEFQERFGIPLRQVYGLTDGGVPVYEPVAGPRRPGAAGRVIEEFEVRIDVTRNRPGDPAGVGEILVRGREPGLVMNGYFGMPEATQGTVEDGWVRTGDVGELDQDGYLTFRGRLSDSIRRRGENISAFEVEQLVESHPGVLEAAAVGVPSELTEEEVMVFVVRRPGAQVNAEELHRHSLAHGPASMAPRYIDFVDALPKTPTEKVEKFRLQERGTHRRSRAWDAERA